MKKYLFYSTLFLIPVLTGCKKDDDDCSDITNPKCSNYDPCWNIQPTADFKMRGTSVGFPVAENLVAEWCDTIFNWGVEFVADMENADSYEWYIGTEIEPRLGRSFKLGFKNYYQDTIQNLNPNNPDYYLPLDITLVVRNEKGQCIGQSDTLLTSSSRLIFTRKLLTRGTFIGRVEGENFERQVIFWKNVEDFSNPIFEQQYFSEIIGLTDDTLKYFGLYNTSIDVLASYKRMKWMEDFNEWWLGPDGIKVWDQEIITSATEPDRVELYFERYPKGSSALEIKRFSGIRVE